MPYMFNQPSRAEGAPYVTFKALFTPDECQRIIGVHRNLKRAVATIGDEKVSTKTDGSRRRTEIYWMEWCSTYDWIFKRIADSVIAANNRWWGFHLSGMQESLQLTQYREVDRGFYDWHEDHSYTPSFSHRKLSVSIALNPGGYTGGEFHFLQSGVVQELETIGTMLVFPSYVTHQVTPVTKGDRWSLVSWIAGPPFV